METKTCCRCGLEKPLNGFYSHKDYPDGHRYECKTCSRVECKKYQQKNRAKLTTYERERKHRLGLARPMETARDCTAFLGVHVAESLLSRLFDHVIVMPNCNPGYDFICGKGFKIDVKSACLTFPERTESGCWMFDVDRNEIADYFMCVGFDNRVTLNPMRLWLFPGNLINERCSLRITNSQRSLKKWVEYERPIDRAIVCCDAMQRR